MVPRVAQLPRLLAPSPERWELACRQALICALTALVVEFYQTPDPALTVYVVFFLNKPDRTTSVLLNVVFLALITFIISLTIIVTMFVIDHPVWRVASIAAISFVFLFLTSASKLRPVGGIIALIVGYGLDLLGTFHSGEIATRALLYAWLFIGIPIGVSLVVNLLIAPAPRRLAQRALADRLLLSSRMLRRPDDKTRAAFIGCLREGAGEVGRLLRPSEKSRAPGHSGAECTRCGPLPSWLASRQRPRATNWNDRDLALLAHLSKHAEDESLLEALSEIKRDNKRVLAALLFRITGISVDPEAMFVVQIKRIHEYRQRPLLACLEVTRDSTGV